jgi:hypothetical protein
MPIDLPTLNAYASQIAGRPVSIHCDTPAVYAYQFKGDTAGVAGFTVSVSGVFQGVIHLPKATCGRLQRIAQGADTIDPLDVLTLMHEATHIALASTDECVVEASAYANVWQLIRQFRLPTWRIRSLFYGMAYADTHLAPNYHCPKEATP